MMAGEEGVRKKALSDMQSHLRGHLDHENAENAIFNAMLYAISEYRKSNDSISPLLIEYLYNTYSDLNKKVHKIMVTAVRGTGQTTGHIAELSVENNSDTPFRLEPQIFFIPATDRYQSYVGSIPENSYLPPNCEITIPIEGYCADPFAPPVPVGEPMTPFAEWVPAFEHFPDRGDMMVQTGPGIVEFGPPPQVPEPMNPPGAKNSEPSAPEPMNPPGGSGDPPSQPERMNPPGEADEPTVPEPMNPPRGRNNPSDFHDVIPPADPVIRLSNKLPLPPFNPLTLPRDTVSEDSQRLDHETFIPTWPGTSKKMKYKIDLEDKPDTYVPVIISGLNRIKEAAVTIQDNPNFKTPFSPDEKKEREAFVQQTFWIYISLITGGDYDEETYIENVIEQIEKGTGIDYDKLEEEDQNNIKSGGESFWTAYSAVGIEAKVFATDSPDINESDPGISDMLLTVSTPACKCDSITYNLHIKRGAREVHDETHHSRNSPTVKVADLKYGDVFDVTISDINAHCACDESPCEFYKPESDNKSRPGYIKTDFDEPGKVEIKMGNDDAGTIDDNANCQNKDKSWNSAEDEYSFTLETRNEGTKVNAIFQRLTIRAYCELDDCRRKLCKKTIQINFVKK